MTDRPTANVYSIADARAARDAASFTQQVSEAEGQLVSETGSPLPMREKVFFRNLGYFAERVCNPAYGGKFTMKVVELSISGQMAVNVKTGVGEWFLLLDDELMINPAIDPIVTSWKGDSPVQPLLSKAPRFKEVV